MPTALQGILIVCLLLSLGVNSQQRTRLKRVPQEKLRIFRSGVTHGAAGFEARVRDDEINKATPLFGFEYLHTVAGCVVDEETTWGRYQDALSIQALVDALPWRGPMAELDMVILERYDLHMKETRNRPPGEDTGGAG